MFCGVSFGPFAVRIIMQPLLFLFVFTYVFPHMGQGNPMATGGGNFATILLPGLMAVAIMFSGIASVALPLSQEFGVTREIDDRVMCPLPVVAVAIEKVCFSALQCILAALLVIPLAYFIPAVPVKPQIDNCPCWSPFWCYRAWWPVHLAWRLAPTSSRNKLDCLFLNRGRADYFFGFASTIRGRI